MGKVPRVDVGGLIYHAYNRANVGARIFEKPKDYQAFENVLTEAKILFNMGILGYCVMPNHWHFVLQPKEDGDMGKFMHWLTVTHVRRWHGFRATDGQGHLYQGAYKSNICAGDEHFLRLIRYVERNALRAGLVEQAEDWRWSSAWRRAHGNKQQKALLAAWPVDMPADYQVILNEQEHDKEELEDLRRSLHRGAPFGAGVWINEMVQTHNLGSTLRPRGRPKKGTESLF